MSTNAKVLFTGKTHTTLTRADGAARNDHGNLDLILSTPDSVDQDLAYAAVAPHPTAEQLFAGAWSACYITALGLVAAQKKVKLPAELSVEIQVDLLQRGNEWFLQAGFDVRMPGVAQELAEQIAHVAHEICPYSKATRGNIEVAVNVITA